MNKIATSSGFTFGLSVINCAISCFSPCESWHLWPFFRELSSESDELGESGGVIRCCCRASTTWGYAWVDLSTNKLFHLFNLLLFYIHIFWNILLYNYYVEIEFILSCSLQAAVKYFEIILEIKTRVWRFNDKKYTSVFYTIYSNKLQRLRVAEKKPTFYVEILI